MSAAQCHAKLLTWSWGFVSAKGLDINRNADDKCCGGSLRATKVAMTKAAKGRAGNDLARPSYVSSYIWLNNGDIIPSWLGMTCLPPWISQRKEKLFFFFLSVGIWYDTCGPLCTSTRNWWVFTQHPEAYSSPSFPMGKFKLLKQCCFFVVGFFVFFFFLWETCPLSSTAALVKNIPAWT